MLFALIAMTSSVLGLFPSSSPVFHSVRLRFHSDSIPIDYRTLADTLEIILKEGLDSAAYPGAQLLVAHKGKTVVHATHGFHTYEKARPVKETDLFDLASITKVTTAVPALMYLVDKRRIDLDQTLCQTFPKLCKSNKRDITLRQALAHHGRLLPYIVYYQKALKRNGKFKRRTFKPVASEKYPVQVDQNTYLFINYKKKIEKEIRKSRLNPERGYVYSGLTFLLYPDLIKEKTGEPLDSFLYNHFFWKLGAGRLTYRPMDRFTLEEIIPTEVDTVFRHKLVHGFVHDEAAAMLHGISCNAGLFGNATDLGKYCQMLLNGGEFNDHRFLSEEVIEEFTRYQFPEEGNRRGLGFDKPPLEGTSYIAPSASPSSYGHSGFTGTFFWIDPEYDFFIILLTNRVHPTRENRKLYSLNIRPRLHQAVYNFLDKNK